MTLSGDSYSPISYYAGEALEDLDFEPIGDGRAECDGCGREMTFDTRSYELAQRLGARVRKLCRPCLKREVMPDVG